MWWVGGSREECCRGRQTEGERERLALCCSNPSVLFACGDALVLYRKKKNRVTANEFEDRFIINLGHRCRDVNFSLAVLVRDF